MASSDDVRRRQNARRPKPQVACTLCKIKKLRCDRKLPCMNCKKRPPGSCVYVSKTNNEGSRSSTSLAPNSPRQVGNNLRQTEYLVNATSNQFNRSFAEVQYVSNPETRINEDTSQNNIHIFRQSGPVSIPELESHGSETRLIDTNSWESVLQDIGSVKSEMRFSTCLDNNASTTDGLLSQPSLLFDKIETTPIENLINSLPSKHVTDRLVNLFTLGLDIPTLCIHLPTFLKDYNAFWKSPKEATLPWLSILYSVISLALQFVLSSGTKIEGILFVETACRQYASKAADCLRSSDYAKPTFRTVEATLMYLVSEHMWLGQHQFRASLILGFAIRLAMRSGYHRDPSHYRQVSVFEGEMRRRVWSWLAQVDVLFATYLGLPQHINSRQSDTALPTDLADEDLYPDMTNLTSFDVREEPSAIGFLNFRAQVTMLLAQIMDHTTSVHECSYEKILELDRALDDQINARPIWLIPPTMSDEHFGDPIKANQALEIDILLQRARIILHRKFFAQARITSEYTQSHDKCVAAALQMLHHQRTMSRIYFEVDEMVVDNWRALSLMSPSFLLGAMITCFDVDRDIQEGFTHGVERFEERLTLLKLCRSILADSKDFTTGIQKAVRAIDIVVSLVKKAGPMNFGENVLDGLLEVPFNPTNESSTYIEPIEALQNMIEGFSTGVDWDYWFFGDGPMPF